MSAGKFVGGAITEAVLKLNPFGPEGYARRDRNKAYRKARRKKRRGEVLTPDEERIMAGEVVKMTLPDGSVVDRVEPTIKARTSTKLLGVGGSFFALTAAAVIPNWEAVNAGLMAACQSEHGPAIGLGMMAAMLGVNYFTARVVKSPAVPGKV